MTFEVRFEDETYAPPAVASRAWMVTFADLVSLMLTFFVMLFAMSSVRIDAWKNMADALTQTLNPARKVSSVAPTTEFSIQTIFRKRAINVDYLAGVLEETVRKDPALTRTRILRLEDFLVVALPGDLLFAPGRAVLSDEARQALFSLGGVLRNLDNEVVVHGHSDPVPPAGGEYPSNWELSLARAVAVANALRRAGYTEDIIAHGFADSRFNDLPGLPEAERRMLARRVDVLVMPTVAGVR